MVLGKPACPNCGSELLVMKIRTGGIFFGHTLDEYDLHRCYRCFTKFSAADSEAETADAGDATDAADSAASEP